MALTTFYGWTEAELLAELKKAQKDFASGGMITGAGAGGVNSTRLVQNNARERIENLQAALYELNSTKYAVFEYVGATETRAKFNP